MRSQAILRGQGAVRKAIDAAVKGAINYGCNQEKARIIALAVRAKINTVAFAEHLGVSRQMVYQWAHKGEEILKSEGNPPKTE